VASRGEDLASRGPGIASAAAGERVQPQARTVLAPLVATSAQLRWSTAVLAKIARVAPDAAALVLRPRDIDVAGTRTRTAGEHSQGVEQAVRLLLEAWPPAQRPDCRLLLYTSCHVTPSHSSAAARVAWPGMPTSSMIVGHVGAMGALHHKATSLAALAADLCAGSRLREEEVLLAAAHALSSMRPGQVCLQPAEGPSSSQLAWPALNLSGGLPGSLLPVASRLRVARRLCFSGLSGSPPSLAHERQHHWHEVETEASRIAMAACGG